MEGVVCAVKEMKKLERRDVKDAIREAEKLRDLKHKNIVRYVDHFVYDGVFYDAFGDEDWPKIKEECPKITKLGSIITLWNGITKANYNNYGFTDNITYEEIDIDPPKNAYLNSKKYYLPKVVV